MEHLRDVSCRGLHPCLINKPPIPANNAATVLVVGVNSLSRFPGSA
jgi:hypothetical protein